ncbi:MAG: thiamine pyrophosphate-binding protein [Methanoregulaceae archaeon]|nr:thiamine pyrophosphate-binding protein [Methanoregulaceae archaeon]
MRVADYITSRLYDAGGECVFIITGGMIMHLSDALLCHGKQRYVCCHHEQSAVMAAEAYGRATGKLGVAYVTAGPGALNTLNSITGAYVDSSPLIVVSGQSKVSQAKITGPRQFALQGFNTLPIFQNVTKYSVMLDDVSRVKYEIEKCIFIAQSHRVGPVWIECPIDIQGALFDPDEYEGYVPPVVRNTGGSGLAGLVREVAGEIRKSRRPSLLAGAGIRLSGATEELHRFVDSVGIPVMTSRLGMDLIDHHHPLFVGRPGTYGDRASNFTIQNSDLLLSIGCRLAIGLVSYDYDNFARFAKKIIVDIDEKELNKPSVRPDIPVCADAREFLEALNSELDGFRFDNPRWVEQTRIWKRNYPVDLPEYRDEKEGINSYHFYHVLSEKAPAESLFLVDTGSCFHAFAQAFQVKAGQRHIITGGLSTMGYMPAAIGLSSANPGKNVYCITGDGSFQMNIQELQTIVHNQLPIKIILLSNNGYLLIRLTQDNFQNGRHIGTDDKTGISFPDLQKISAAYGLKYLKLSDSRDLNERIVDIFTQPGPMICEIMSPGDQVLIPRIASKSLEDGRMVSMPYDDMFPFLPREEYLRNNVRDTIT